MPESLHLLAASEDTAWGAWLAQVPHDFYHTAAYHRFSARWERAEGFLTVYGDRHRYLAWPHLLRPLSGGLRDVTSVYGYPGPLLYGCAPTDPFVERAAARILELWRSQGAVTVFTRFHPMLENHLGLCPERVVPGGQTVAIDLGLSEEAQWGDYQSGLRNRINRSHRLGLRTAPDPAWGHLADFARFYRAAMERNRAAPRYLFPLEYFQDLRRTLGSHAALMVTRLGEEVAAAGIFTEYGGMVQNHFAMNNPAHLQLAPTKVLLDDVRRWAAARGNRVFHLGGGRSGAADSLFAFKAAFSRWRLSFYTGRWILDPAACARLSEGRSCAAGEFFPPYSAPIDRPEVSLHA